MPFLRSRVLGADLRVDDVGPPVGLSVRPMIDPDATAREPLNRRSRVKVPTFAPLSPRGRVRMTRTQV
jgi:hypothetical protein